MPKICRHCGRSILWSMGTWYDPEAPLTGDDSIWRAVCDSNVESFVADHEPELEHPHDYGYYEEN